jgi:hypothetical protein
MKGEIGYGCTHNNPRYPGCHAGIGVGDWGRTMRKPLNTITALRVEELRLSKRQLKDDLRAQGIKLHSYSMAQLTAEAKKRMSWFAHDAFRNILQERLEDALGASLKTCARNSEADKSMASVVQMSRTLEGVK